MGKPKWSERGKIFPSKESYDKFVSVKKGQAHKSFSKNKNPVATRKPREKQTYQFRDYGEFRKEHKILIRYNKLSTYDLEHFIDKIRDDIQGLVNEIDFDNVELLNYGRDVAQASLQKYCPIDTGALRDSLYAEVSPDGGLFVNSDLPYANAQNYGKYGQANGRTRNGKLIYAWYPGYFFYEKAMNDALTKMAQKQRTQKKKRESNAQRRANGT